MKSFGLLIIGIIPFLLVACQTNSTGDPSRHPNQLAVNSRIKNNSEYYAKLSSSQKKAVNQGSVTKGMSKNGVRLAWGKPDKIQEIKSSSGKREQWTYYRMEQSNFDNSPTGKFSRYFRGSEKYYDGHTTSDYRSVQVEDRTVVFAGGRVVSWTQTRY